VSTSSVDAVCAKFDIARRELGELLVDREEEIELALTALLAGEHVLLVGPPGCGKSLLVDSLLAWAGGRKFSALLTRFSVPEELFGPVSLSGLKEDRYRRVTTGMLPEADFVFLDEIFRGSSAIINTVLKLLNERTFENGDGVPRPVPLKLCLAASNEWPAPEVAKELGALFDRFMLRRTVVPIRTHEGRQRLLWSERPILTFSKPMLSGELAIGSRAAASLPWSAEARDALNTILRELVKEGIRPGDRRQVKTVGIVRAYAFLHGAEIVQPEHLEVAAHCLWDDPTEQPQVTARIIARIANPPGMRISGLLQEAEQIISSADSRDLAQAATATAKLGEIERQLGALAGDPRASRLRGYVREQIKRLRLDSLSSV
jgi:MoxR-like ATPase